MVWTWGYAKSTRNIWNIRLGQGKENVKTRLENEPELLEKIEEEVRKILNKGKEEESTEEILEVKEGVLDFDEEI